MGVALVVLIEEGEGVTVIWIEGEGQLGDIVEMGGKVRGSQYIVFLYGVKGGEERVTRYSQKGEKREGNGDGSGNRPHQ